MAADGDFYVAVDRPRLRPDAVWPWTWNGRGGHGLVTDTYGARWRGGRLGFA